MAGNVKIQLLTTEENARFTFFSPELIAVSIRTKNQNSVNFYSIVATIVNVLLPGSADSKITVEITGKLKEFDRLAAALQTANDPTRIRFRSAGTVQNDVRIQSVGDRFGLGTQWNC